jgi:hypothetical protein
MLTNNEYALRNQAYTRLAELNNRAEMMKEYLKDNNYIQALGQSVYSEECNLILSSVIRELIDLEKK